MKKWVVSGMRILISVSICLVFITGGCNKGSAKSVAIDPEPKDTLDIPDDNSGYNDSNVIVLPGGYMLDTNTSAKLIFSSGFNSGVYITEPPVYEKGTRGLFLQWLKGTDNVTGSTWPIDDGEFACERPTVLFMLAAGPRDAVIPDPGIYMENKLVTVNGYDGKPNRVLYNAFYKAMPGGTGGGQNWQYIYPDPDKEVVKELYFRYRMKFPASLEQEMQTGSHWHNFFFFKTKHTDWRNEAGIRYNDGEYYWRVAGSYLPDGASQYTTVWSKENHEYPVSFGKWFNVEVYWYVSAHPNKGRLFWSIDGHVIADYHGANKRINNIDRVGTFGNYGTDTYNWIDDYEMWSAPPCGELPCIVEQPLEE